MPLVKSANRAAVGPNIKAEMAAGKPQKQAEAIALSVQRRAQRADGGQVSAAILPFRRADGGQVDGTSALKQAMTSPAASVAAKIDQQNAQRISGAVPRGNTLPAVQGFAGGGLPQAPWFIRRSAQQMAHIGAINSPVAGRTDHIPLNVASGSYVVPADIVSGLGQGNTSAGHKVLGQMFKTGPYGMGASAVKPASAKPPKAPKMPGLSPTPPGMGFGSTGSTSMGSSFADGGQANSEAPQQPTLVPIMAAGGEHVLSPDQVATVGDGDLKKGHEALDQWVKLMREKHVNTLKKLPGPAKR